jgi:hypothetical protein
VSLGGCVARLDAIESNQLSARATIARLDRHHHTITCEYESHATLLDSVHVPTTQSSEFKSLVVGESSPLSDVVVDLEPLDRD